MECRRLFRFCAAWRKLNTVLRAAGEEAQALAAYPGNTDPRTVADPDDRERDGHACIAALMRKTPESLRA